MLCPEVWNFEAPQDSFKISKGKSREDLLNDNASFNFTHLVCAILPNVLNVPNDINSVLTEDCEYYKICNLNPSHLLDTEFISSFILNGRLSLLSINRRIDCDDCIAITPKGLLILSVNKETYQSLGIEGKVSHFHSKIKSRYVVTVDLTDTKTLHPDTSNCKRLKQHLSNLESIDVIATWQPPDVDICPSSLAKYFVDLKYTVKECCPKFSSSASYNTKVPLISFEEDEVDVANFVEWLGMVALEADLNTQGGPGNYLNTYVTPERSADVGQVKVLKWRGFFTMEKVNELLKKIMIEAELPKNQWIAIYVQSFSDTPAAWDTNEHHFYTNGDSGYLLIFDKEKGLFCTQACSGRRYK